MDDARKRAEQEVAEYMHLQPHEVPRGHIVDMTERAIRAEDALAEAVRLLEDSISTPKLYAEARAFLAQRGKIGGK